MKFIYIFVFFANYTYSSPIERLIKHYEKSIKKKELSKSQKDRYLFKLNQLKSLGEKKSDHYFICKSDIGDISLKHGQVWGRANRNLIDKLNLKESEHKDRRRSVKFVISFEKDGPYLVGTNSGYSSFKKENGEKVRFGRKKEHRIKITNGSSFRFVGSVFKCQFKIFNPNTIVNMGQNGHCTDEGTLKRKPHQDLEEPPKKKQKLLPMHGMHNTDGYCFANASLLFLFSGEEFKRYLKDLKENKCSTKSREGKKFQFVESLLSLYEQAKSESVSPHFAFDAFLEAYKEHFDGKLRKSIKGLSESKQKKILKKWESLKSKKRSKEQTKKHKESFPEETFYKFFMYQSGISDAFTRLVLEILEVFEESSFKVSYFDKAKNKRVSDYMVSDYIPKNSERPYSISSSFPSLKVESLPREIIYNINKTTEDQVQEISDYTNILINGVPYELKSAIITKEKHETAYAKIEGEWYLFDNNKTYKVVDKDIAEREQKKLDNLKIRQKYLQNRIDREKKKLAKLQRSFSKIFEEKKVNKERTLVDSINSNVREHNQIVKTLKEQIEYVSFTQMHEEIRKYASLLRYEIK